MGIRSVPSEAENAIGLLSEIITEATLPGHAIEAERANLVQEIAEVLENPISRLREFAIGRTVFGDGHPLGQPKLGFPETVEKLNQSILKDVYENDLIVDPVVIALGPLPVDALERLQGLLQDRLKSSHIWNRPSTLPVIPPCNVRTNNLVMATDANAQNAYMSLNCRVDRDLRDRAKLRFASALLGESFAARMFRIIRDERGLCYIAHTSLMFSGDYSVLSSMMDVDKPRVHEAISSLVEITGDLSTSPVPEGEFEITKDYVLGKMDLDFDNPFSLLFLLASHAYSGGGLTDLRSYYKDLEQLTIDDFHAWCKNAIQRKNLTLTVDGCAPGQEKQVEESWDAARA